MMSRTAHDARCEGIYPHPRPSFPGLSPGDSSSWKGWWRVRRGGLRFLVCFLILLEYFLFRHRTAQVPLSGRPGARRRDVFGKVEFRFWFYCRFKIIVSYLFVPISWRLHGVTTYSGEYGCVFSREFFFCFCLE